MPSVSKGKELIATERNQGGPDELASAQDYRSFFTDKRQFRDCAGTPQRSTPDDG
jgi:hypothetical protein